MILGILTFSVTFAIFTYWLYNIYSKRGKVVQNLEPQESNMMEITTKVYFGGDVVKQWTVKVKFSKVEQRAIAEKKEGEALIKIYKKIKN